MGCNSIVKQDVLCCNAFGDQPVCRYLGKNGCTVKSLRCALWLCSRDLFPTEAVIGVNPSWSFTIGMTTYHFMNREHQEIFIEARKYRLLRYFRQGKMIALEYAYSLRDTIKEEVESEALTPEEYLRQQEKRND
jgi:hypothetical protein